MKAKTILWRLLPPPFNLDKEERKRFGECMDEINQSEDGFFMAGEDRVALAYQGAIGRNILLDCCLYAVGYVILSITILTMFVF